MEKEKRKFSIAEMAMEYVKQYLRDVEHVQQIEEPKHGADIIADGRFIDVKGCQKWETNIRMAQQALDSIAEEGKLKQGSFYIYYVYDMSTENPQLMKFDYNTFKANKQPEIRWLIQPKQLKEKPQSIPLKKIEF